MILYEALICRNILYICHPHEKIFFYQNVFFLFYFGIKIPHTLHVRLKRDTGHVRLLGSGEKTVYIFIYCVDHIVFQIQKRELVYLPSGHHVHIETYRAFRCANAKLMIYRETGGRRGEEHSFTFFY